MGTGGEEQNMHQVWEMQDVRAYRRVICKV